MIPSFRFFYFYGFHYFKSWIRSFDAEMKPGRRSSDLIFEIAYDNKASIYVTFSLANAIEASLADI